VRALFLPLTVVLATGSAVDSSGGSSAQASKSAEAIGWEKAREQVGKVVTVEGTVYKANRRPTGISLSLHPTFPDYFQVIIPAVAIAKWKVDPSIYYNKRLIRVTGKVEESQGHHFIRLTDPKQIERVQKKPTS